MNAATIKPLALALTIATGETFQSKIDPENHIHMLIGESAIFTIRQPWNAKGRITIQCATNAKYSPRTGESITADESRDPAAIARDIKNRLLPAARAYLQECQAYNDERERAEARKNLRKNLIMRYLPKEHSDGKFCSITTAGNWKARVYAEETYDDLINIEVNLRLPEALKLLKQLTEAAP